MPHADTIFFSLLGGVIPSVIWLLFWLKEDNKRPEPRGLIMATFFAGMLAVPLVIPFQKALEIESTQKATVFIWSFLEESFKLLAAYLVAIRRKEANEPVDVMIYMMTAALGFSALENALYIFHPLSKGLIIESFITGNVRFIGASLLHTLSSATIGIALALPFYKQKEIKIIDLCLGLTIATVLHAVFNLFIIEEHNGTTFATFGFVWISIIVLLLFFEKIKRIYPVNKI